MRMFPHLNLSPGGRGTLTPLSQVFEPWLARELWHEIVRLLALRAYPVQVTREAMNKKSTPKRAFLFFSKTPDYRLPLVLPLFPRPSEKLLAGRR